MNYRKFLFFSLFIFLAARAFAQDPWIKSSTERFNIFAGRAVQEKMYLHIDRPFYIVGESMWFKAYNVEGASNGFLNMSSVGYLEILDRDNNPVAQSKFGLLGGKGNGSLIIPSSIASGTYKVRSYTNWMKNFDCSYYFETSVTIVNPFARFDPNPVPEKENAYDVQFFPEGGRLLNDMACKIAFRATDSNGKGVNFRGVVCNQNSDTLVSFAPTKFGIGSFSLTPREGDFYKAFISVEGGSSQEVEFPKAEPEGYVMAVSDVAANKVIVNVNAKYGDSEPGDVYVIVHTRQQNLKVQRVEMTRGQGSLIFDKSTFGDGISHITLFDRKWRPLCERLYFKYPDRQLLILGTSDKKGYITREKITLDLSASINKIAEQGANMSVAVYLEDSIKVPSQENISDYLLLSSDIKGIVESPDYYFNGSDADVEKHMDNLMLTHGWRRFVWRNVYGSVPEYTHLPEYKGHFIEAIMTDKKTGEPIANSEAYLAAPDFPARLYTAYTNSKGRLRFEVKDFFGPMELTFQANTSKDTNAIFDVLSPFDITYTSKSVRPFFFNKKWEGDLLNRAINMQTGNAFTPKTYLLGNSSIADTLAFFGVPDEKYFLDAYTRFPTMEEVFREYVRGVFVRRRQKEFHFRMADKLAPHTMYSDDPLVLLDGIPVFDIDKIIAFDPLKVKKIELLNGKYFLGSSTFFGIVSLTTYGNNLSGFELDPHVKIVNYDGFQPIREFYAPKYENKIALGSRSADLRNLLYWAPDVSTDANGNAQLQFYSSDQAGKYKVVVQSLSKGKGASYSFSFNVGKRGI